MKITRHLIDNINNDQDKVSQIINLENDIKKYFKCGRWSYFAKQAPFPWLSLIKSVFKAVGINIKLFTVKDKTIDFVKRGFVVDIK